MMKTKSINYYLYIERASYIAAIICVLAVCAYGLMIRAIMVNASSHQSLSRSMSEASSKLGELEFEYITLKQAVTIKRATELGFSEAKNPTFVKAYGDSGVSMTTR